MEEHTTSLLVGWLKNELTDVETRELFQWVYKSRENEKLFYQLKDIWETARYREISEQANTAAAWEKLAYQAVKEKTAESLNKKQNTRRIIQALQIAAIVAITFGVGFFVQKLMPEKRSYSYISVPYGAKSKVELADGSQIWVNSGSTLKYPNNIDTKEVDIFLEGEAFFDIAKKTDRKLNVKTSTINIQVLGTAFNVKSYNDENMVETTLVKGSISITGKVGEKVIKEPILLKPKEQASLNKTSGSIEVGDEMPKEIAPTKPNANNNDAVVKREPRMKIVENVDIHEFIAWKDNQLVFKNETLENLAAKLERWYNVDIVVKDNNLKKSRYTGVFEKETLEQAIEALSISLPFNYSITKNQIEISKPIKNN